jgi:hypothetical protein
MQLTALRAAADARVRQPAWGSLVHSTCLVSLLGLALVPGLIAQADRYACRVQFEEGEPPQRRAIRCAEEFITRNGYTDRAPTVDSAQIAHEPIEFGTDLRTELQQRHSTLEERAFGVCSGSPRDSTGFTVVFRYRTNSGAARAVTMDSLFARLRVEHQDFLPSAVAQRKYGCVPAVSVPVAPFEGGLPNTIKKFPVKEP